MSEDISPEQYPGIPDEYLADIDYADFEPVDRHPPDWLTKVDYEIIHLLATPNLVLTPAVIAKNIDRSRSAVSRRLNTLEAGGIVEKVERGYYQMTPEGISTMYETIPEEHLDELPNKDAPEGMAQFKIPTANEAERIDWD